MQVINLHSYAIYKLHEKHVNTHPWMDNTTLLVLGNNDSMSASVQKDFIKYLTGGGKILSLCSSFTCNVKKLPWDDKCCPFPASVEVNHPEFFQGEPQNLSALCEPFYFEGECSDIIFDLSLLITWCVLFSVHVHVRVHSIAHWKRNTTRQIQCTERIAWQLQKCLT